MSRTRPPGGRRGRAAVPPPAILERAAAFDAFRAAAEAVGADFAREEQALTAAVALLPPGRLDDEHLGAVAGWLSAAAAALRRCGLGDELSRVAVPHPPAVGPPAAEATGFAAAVHLFRTALAGTTRKTLLGELRTLRPAEGCVLAGLHAVAELVPALLWRRRFAADDACFTDALERAGLTVDDIEPWYTGRAGRSHGLSRDAADCLGKWLGAKLYPGVPLVTSSVPGSSTAERHAPFAVTATGSDGDRMPHGAARAAVGPEEGTRGTLAQPGRSRKRTQAETDALVAAWFRRHQCERPERITRDRIATETGASSGAVSRSPMWLAFAARKRASASPAERTVPLTDTMLAAVSGRDVSAAELAALIEEQVADEAEDRRRHTRR